MSTFALPSPPWPPIPLEALKGVMDLIEQAWTEWRDFRRGHRAPEQEILPAVFDRARAYLPLLEAVPPAERTRALFLAMAAGQHAEL